MDFIKIGKRLLKSSGIALDMVYPRTCVLCGCNVGQEQRYICWDCLAGLSFIRFPFCKICGNPVYGAIDDEFICSWCRSAPPFFDNARSACRYDADLQKIVHAFKYGGATWLAYDLADWLTSVIRANYLFNAVDAVVCVPLHFWKKRKRTYNQSELLAEYVAGRLSKPLACNILRRVEAGATQTHLTAAQRRENVRGVFAVRNRSRLSGKSFILIDDVMTTGATVNECAKVMKAAGAKSVYVVTVARG